MLMILMSLAISLACVQSFHSLHQKASSNQTTRVPKQNKEKAPAAILLKSPGVPVTPIVLPPGDGAWSVQIVERGGFVGSGRGDLTVTSEGIVTWIGEYGGCNQKLADDDIQALGKTIIAAIQAPIWGEDSSSSLCSDCYVTTMVLQRRGSRGLVSAAVASWDDATQAKIPTDVLTIYEAVMAHKGCGL